MHVTASVQRSRERGFTRGGDMEVGYAWVEMMEWCVSGRACVTQMSVLSEGGWAARP